MANVFKNSITGSIGTVTTGVYTTPPLTVATVIGVNLANIITENISVDIQLFDSSQSVSRFLIKNALITPGASLVAVGGDQKVVLEEGDELRVTSSQPTSTDVIISVLEIS
jgi:hypothetical protein